MYQYFIKNGFSGERTTSNVIKWLLEKGYSFFDYASPDVQPCREIFLYGQKIGEIWCDDVSQLDYTMLEYISDNDLMRLSDAV